jgi:predicted GNAT family acetyltransferase
VIGDANIEIIGTIARSVVVTVPHQLAIRVHAMRLPFSANGLDMVAYRRGRKSRRYAINVEITRTESWLRGRYEARIKGKDATGELTYRKLGVHAVVAEHTGVPQALRGKGIATKLVERLVDDAKKEGFKIVPACPFVKALFDKHPEWSSLLHPV